VKKSICGDGPAALFIISAIGLGCDNQDRLNLSLQTNPNLSTGPYLIGKGQY
jgi:hypothetical protein